MTRALIPWTEDIWGGLDLVDRLLEEWSRPLFAGYDTEWVPAFDISENEKEFVVEAELPGIDPKELQVYISDGILTVKGEKKKEEREENYCLTERAYGAFARSFRIPEDVMTDKVDATYKNGVLRLVLPKAEAQKPKKIEVK